MDGKMSFKNQGGAIHAILCRNQRQTQSFTSDSLKFYRTKAEEAQDELNW